MEDNNRNTILRAWMVRIVEILFFILGHIPRRIQHLLAGGLGRLLYSLDTRHRNVAIENIKRAFGSEKTHAQIRAIARSTFKNLCHIVFEIGWVSRLKEDQFTRYFSISGQTNYDKAVSEGKGVILITGHFSNWELLPVIAHMAGMRLHIVYRSIDNTVLDQFFKNNRSRFGGKLIPTHMGAMQKIFRALRRTDSVGLLIDQNEGWRQGIFIDFFGHRACTNPGITKLALKSDAPVVPLFLRRENGKFYGEFGPAIRAKRTGDAFKDLEINTQIYNDVVESYVRRYPDQWFWVHQRWKTRPMCKWPDPERRARWTAGQKRRGLL